MNFKKTLFATSLALALSISSVSSEILSCDQIESLTAQYFPANNSLITTMICISHYESSWNTNAENPSGATGLFQIMPEHCGGLCPQCSTQSDLYDKDINTECALEVYNAQGLGAWQTYDEGDCENWTGCSASSSSGGSNSGTSSNSGGSNSGTSSNSGDSSNSGTGTSGTGTSGTGTSGTGTSGTASSGTGTSGTGSNSNSGSGAANKFKF